MTAKQPSLPRKILFWVILGLLSTCLAEIIAGSSMFPFFDGWGLFVVIPLYSLHILVLSHIVFHHGKPRLYVLFIAGAILGMYEAYITKVLWEPYWGPSMFSFAGIAVVETILLVFFWHAFLAFIVPLFVAETTLTSSRSIFNGLPDRLRNLFSTKKKALIMFAMFAIFFGSFQSINSPTPVASLTSATSAAIIILVFMFLFRRTKEQYDMKSLLPGKKAFWILFAMLILFYVFWGSLMRPEVIPGLGPQMIIVLMYAGLFLMLYLHLKKSRKMSLGNADLPVKLSFKLLLGLAVLFSVSSAIGVPLLLGGPFALFVVALFAFFNLIGIAMIILSIKDLKTNNKS